MGNYTEEEIERLESYIKLFVKKNIADKEGKINALKKRERRLLYFLIGNVIAVIFFAYSYFHRISTLNNTMYLVLFGIFILNVFLIMYQKKQIRRVIEYILTKD